MADDPASAGAASPLSQALRLPSGKDVYDGLMALIEPELLTDAIPMLTETYKDETPEARQTRLERYAAAYDIYDRAYAAWLRRVSQGMAAFKRVALESAEQGNKEEEATQLLQLESSMASAAPRSSAA